MSTPTGHQSPGQPIEQSTLPNSLKGPKIILDMADRQVSKDGPFRILGSALTYLLSDFFGIAFLHFYHASICEGGLGSRNSVSPSVRPSLCLSVCLSHAWIVTKLNDALQIFLYHMQGQSLCYSDTKSGWWATPPSL